MHESGAARISMNKGYDKNGFDNKMFHLHIRLFGDNECVKKTVPYK